MSHHGSVAVFCSFGQLRLTRQIGKGGEGSIYEIAGRPELAAKVYHRPLPPERSAKIEAMVAVRPETLLSVAAWPLELLRSPSGEPCGLIMERFVEHKDIYKLYNPRSRKLEFPGAEWRFLVRAAANTARAFAAIHKLGYVIGDVNHSGLLVSPQARVKVIDCDSFQVDSSGRRFSCDVGVSTFTPPELQGQALRGVDRTANHDNFGLSVMLFHLLFLGRHPFAGRFIGHGEMSIESAIAEFRYAYSKTVSRTLMEPPPGFPSVAIASEPVVELFERAFGPDGACDHGRPAAREWIQPLEELESRLIRCGKSAAHSHLSSLESCPWCKLDAASGSKTFQIIFRHTTVIRFDLGHNWEQIAAMPSPGPAPSLPEASNRLPPPSAAARQQSQARITRSILGYSILGSILLALAGTAPVLAVLFLLLGFKTVPAVRRWARSCVEHERFSEARVAATADLDALMRRWEVEATDQRFNDCAKALEHARKQLDDLDRVRRERYQQLELGRKDQQLRRHLERSIIEWAAVPGIGPGRKAMLASYNIQTAFDISAAGVAAVPGFGPAIVRKLVEWRREREQVFRFDPTRSVDPEDIAALDVELAELKTRCRAELAAGAATLADINRQILHAREALVPLIKAARKALLQAQADLLEIGG